MILRAIAGALLVIVLLTGCAGRRDDTGDFAEVPGIGATRIDVPRPANDATADCTAALATDETIVERVAGLRRIGLFADRAALTDEALGDEVTAAVKEVWGDQLKSDEPLMDLFVAEQDTDRAWWRDLEADVAEGNEVYATTIEEWAAISVGAFTVSGIRETWVSENGPVTVAFERDGISHLLRPEYFEDWIDPRIATPINALIAPSGRRFEFFQAFDQTAFVMALTSDERAALEHRGWCFE